MRAPAHAPRISCKKMHTINDSTQWSSAMYFWRPMRHLALVTLFAYSGLFFPRSAIADEQEFTYQQQKMGTIFQILIYSNDQKTADDAAEAAWHRIEQINDTFID
jgi:hypothetical protein